MKCQRNLTLYEISIVNKALMTALLFSHNPFSSLYNINIRLSDLCFRKKCKIWDKKNVNSGSKTFSYFKSSPWTVKLNTLIPELISWMLSPSAQQSPMLRSRAVTTHLPLLSATLIKPLPEKELNNQWLHVSKAGEIQGLVTPHCPFQGTSGTPEGHKCPGVADTHKCWWKFWWKQDVAEKLLTGFLN